jgi:hypothetical protein
MWQPKMAPPNADMMARHHKMHQLEVKWRQGNQQGCQPNQTTTAWQIDYWHAKKRQRPSACLKMPLPNGGIRIDECAGWMKKRQRNRHQITGQKPNDRLATKDE